MGESVNAFIVRSVNETLARDNENKWFCRVAVLLKNEQNPLYPAARYAILDIEEKKPEAVDFKTVMTGMSNKIEKNILDNISTSTCFVCYLHLCNEKSKLLL